eukprot:PITA_03680
MHMKRRASMLDEDDFKDEEEEELVEDEDILSTITMERQDTSQKIVRTRRQPTITKHMASLRLMLDICRGYQISLNLKKCIFCVPFGILLGHVVCKQGLMVDPVKIAVIVNLPSPKIVRQLCTMLRHTSYYKMFIKGYAQMTVPMENLLKKETTFQWDEECQKSLDVLKEKLVTAPILVCLDWKKEFHVHVDASCIALGVVLV